MDETTQQLIALTIVAGAVMLVLLRRYRKKKAGKPGCDNCDVVSGAKTNDKGEAPQETIEIFVQQLKTPTTWDGTLFSESAFAKPSGHTAVDRGSH